MKKLLLLFFCIGGQLAAQPFLSIYGDSDYGHFGKVALPTSDGGHLLIGEWHIYIPDAIPIHGSSIGFSFVKTDGTGDTVWTKQINTLYQTQIKNAFLHDDGSFSVFSNRWDSYSCNGLGVSWPYPLFQMITYDSLGNLLNEQVFGQECSWWLYDVIQKADGSYLLLGGSSEMQSSSEMLRLWQISGNGSVVWDQAYPAASTKSIARFTPIMEGKMMGIGIDRLASGNDWDVFVTHLDSLGNALWAHPLTDTMIQRDVVKILPSQDGNYYVLAGEDLLTSPFSFNQSILFKIDSSAAIIWKKTYQMRAVDLKQWVDGRLILLGMPEGFADDSVDIWIDILSPEGDSLARRIYGGDFFDEPFNLSLTADGYTLIGTAQCCSYDTSIGPAKILLVQDTLHQPSNWVSPLRNLSFRLFPNPSSGIIHVEAESESFGRPKLTIVDMTGRILHSWQSEPTRQLRRQIDLGKYPSGTYLLKLSIGEQIEYQKLVLVK